MSGTRIFQVQPQPPVPRFEMWAIEYPAEEAPPLLPAYSLHVEHQDIDLADFDGVVVDDRFYFLFSVSAPCPALDRVLSCGGLVIEDAALQKLRAERERIGHVLDDEDVARVLGANVGVDDDP
jgi:hypothetical protein